MKTEQQPYPAVLSLTALVLVIILISSTAMASPVGNSSSARPNGFVTNFDTNNVTLIDNATNNNVTATVPFADFTSNVSKGYVPLTVQFNDSSQNATAWNWDFGDGSNSTEQNPVHTYYTAGTYTVSLTAGNENGTSSKLATINVLVAAAYITNYGNSTVSVIDTASNTVSATLKVGARPFGVAVNPQGTKLYVTNPYGSNTVSVIDIARNVIIATVPVGGNSPHGIVVTPDGAKAYVTNSEINNVSVIDTATNKVTTTVNVGSYPIGVTVTPDGKNIYVTNFNSNTVSVIDTATNAVIATVPVGNNPYGIAANPQGTKVYVTNYRSNSVSVIDSATNAVIATVPVGSVPYGVALNPQGTKVYVTNYRSNSVSVIDSATNTVIATIPVGKCPYGVAVTPDGKRVYVANWDSNSVSVIDIAANKVTESINVGSNPVAFGQFTGPRPAQMTLPVANFSTNVTEGYVPLTVQFTDLSENATERYWDFGDGANSTMHNPMHTYSTEGNYAVTLTISNANGTDSKLAKISVSAQPVLPVAAFTASPISGSAPLIVNFTDGSLGSPTAWKWYFSDGTNSTVQNPVHTFSNPGRYYVTLTASNAAGSSSVTKLSYIIVSNGVTLDAAFSASPTSGSAPLTVNFTDTSTGSPTSWQWYFSDGTNSTVQNPVHTFSKSGLYSVTLTASNAAGSSSVTKSSYIYVPNSLNDSGNAPIADFSAFPTSGSAPLKVSFNASSVGSPTSWQWFFGEYGTNTTDQNPVHTFSKPGLYTIILTARNAWGSSAVTKLNYIYVKSDLSTPVAAFSASPTSGNPPLTVSFTDTSTGSPTAWRWSFSDGTNSTDQNIVHTFSKPGPYSVTLTVSNAGGSSSVTKPSYIVVSNDVTAPVAAFSASPTSGSAPLTVSFTDTSAGSPTSWKWYFSDGTSSTDRNPVHTFSNTGRYYVSLTASNAGGSSSVTKLSYITVLDGVTAPVAAFSASPTSGSAPLTVSFTDTSTGSPTSWKWSFSDGTSSTDQNPVHTFNKSGLYSVTLTASNTGGSSATTMSRYIKVK